MKILYNKLLFSYNMFWYCLKMTAKSDSIARENEEIINKLKK